MRNHAQNPSGSHSHGEQTLQANKPIVPRKALFRLVIYRNKMPVTLFNNLDFYEALALSICHPEARIKFDRMEVVQ